jgi:hypothetical protein
MSIKDSVLATYLGNGDPALTGYYPAWLDNLADDATVEGSLLDGAVRGAEAVRSIVVTIRSLYDHQEHKFAGPCGDNGFLEDYVAGVLGEPIGCVVLVARNAAGQTQRVVASYRPVCCTRSSPAPHMASNSLVASPEEGGAGVCVETTDSDHMPRDGVIIFRDLVGKLTVLRITCDKCGRSGQYRLDRLIMRYGIDAKLFEWSDEITADCPRKQARNLNDQCGARCPDVPKVV